MCSFLRLLYLLTILMTSCESARILAVFPTPSISHQVVFRPFTQELAKRGHEVVVITTDPAFPEGQTPENLTEIDIHDISYNTWIGTTLKEVKKFNQTGDKALTGKKYFYNSIETLYSSFLEVFQVQIQNDKVQKLLQKNKNNFDLLIIEAWTRPYLVFSYIYKAPVILFSSLGNVLGDYDIMGAPSHPLLEPSGFRNRIHDLSFLEKVSELYLHYSLRMFYNKHQEKENKVLKKHFGTETPTLNELVNNVALLFINIHPVFEGIWPVPPSVIHVGGMHVNQVKRKPLPKDLQMFLDKSKNGVVYVSFGSNVNPSTIDPIKIQIMLNVFSKIPYDILWKWDKDELPGKPDNIKISKWLPQFDILGHSKVKVFITQGGLQSTDEAITSGVPLIGIPMLGDQWFNTEKYVYHKIGMKLDIDELTEYDLKTAIITVIEDKSYRLNVLRLQSIMQDQPQQPLQRAVWWTEHVLKYGAGHLRAPTANISWMQYYEGEIIIVVITFVMFIFIVGIVLFLWLCIKRMFKFVSKNQTKHKKF